MILAGVSCKDSAKPKDSSATPAQSFARGKAVYMANCIACHNADPSKDGGVGPAIQGASRELLETRVLAGKYPPGYTPKRKTGLMPAQPYLKDDIPAIHAFLNSTESH